MGRWAIALSLFEARCGVARRFRALFVSRLDRFHQLGSKCSAPGSAGWSGYAFLLKLLRDIRMGLSPLHAKMIKRETRLT
jgi:hypothetical protein